MVYALTTACQTVSIMQITKYKPNQSFRDVFFPKPFNSLFNEIWNDEVLQSSVNFFRPSVDVMETENQFEIHLSIPGLKKEEIKIDLKNDVLTISGERKQKEEKREAKYLLGEIRYGKFSRTFHLPENVDRNSIEASFNDGILEVIIPKAEEEKPQAINIK